MRKGKLVGETEVPVHLIDGGRKIERMKEKGRKERGKESVEGAPQGKIWTIHHFLSRLVITQALKCTRE